MNDDELVAKLRESGPFMAPDGYMSILLPEHHDAHVAADRIEELSTDNERLRAAGNRLHDAVNAAEQPPTPQQDMDIDSALEAWEALGEES